MRLARVIGFAAFGTLFWAAAFAVGFDLTGWQFMLIVTRLFPVAVLIVALLMPADISTLPRRRIRPPYWSR